MANTEDFKIVFSPGAFDDVPEEDREGLMAAIQEAVKSGALFTESTPVDLEKLEAEEPEVYDKLISQIEKESVEGEDQFFEILISDIEKE